MTAKQVRTKHENRRQQQAFLDNQTITQTAEDASRTVRGLECPLRKSQTDKKVQSMGEGSVIAQV